MHFLRPKPTSCFEFVRRCSCRMLPQPNKNKPSPLTISPKPKYNIQVQSPSMSSRYLSSVKSSDTVMIPANRAVDFSLLGSTEEVILLCGQKRHEIRKRLRQMLHNSMDQPEGTMFSSSGDDSLDGSLFLPCIQTPRCRSVDSAGRIVAFDHRLSHQA